MHQNFHDYWYYCQCHRNQKLRKPSKIWKTLVFPVINLNDQNKKLQKNSFSPRETKNLQALNLFKQKNLFPIFETNLNTFMIRKG